MHFKPIADLTKADLLAYPIWEFATSEELEGDETYVAPLAAPSVPAQRGDHQVYHVACDIRTAMGGELVGFMSFCEGELHDPVPTVVGDAAHDFSLEQPPRRRDEAAFEVLMGGAFESLFPVTWCLRAVVGTEATLRSGTFDGRS